MGDSPPIFSFRFKSFLLYIIFVLGALLKKIISIILIFSLPSCFYFHTEVDKLSIDNLKESRNYEIKSPTKVHLNNGELIVYEKGFILEKDTLFGSGTLYNTLRDSSRDVLVFPFDSTAFYEYYSNVFEPETILLTAPAALIGTSVLLIAIFGSCPTIYSYADSTSTLEAELFSYSVAEMFEQPDLDKLNYLTPDNGQIKIKLTNEALETHYIDKLKLGVAEHDNNYTAFPTDEEEIILVGEYTTPTLIQNKNHELIHNDVCKKDSLYYRSDIKLLEKLKTEITSDWIDLEVDVPAGKDEAVIVINYKNTLLNTILLYDVMLSSQGAEAVDWIGDKTSNLWYAYNFDKWYRSHFGIHVKVFEDGEYSEVYRLSDTGPIIWHESAFKIDVPDDNKLKIRLEFLPDNFMIDQIGVSFDLSEDFEYEECDISEIKNKRNLSITSSQLLNEDDEEYFVTYPGDNYDVTFNLPRKAKNKKQSYFISSDGYYVEWIRKDWIKNGAALNSGKVFDYNDEAIKRTAEIWLTKRSAFEKLFEETKIK